MRSPGCARRSPPRTRPRPPRPRSCARPSMHEALDPPLAGAGVSHDGAHGPRRRRPAPARAAPAPAGRLSARRSPTTSCSRPTAASGCRSPTAPPRSRSRPRRARARRSTSRSSATRRGSRACSPRAAAPALRPARRAGAGAPGGRGGAGVAARCPAGPRGTASRGRAARPPHRLRAARRDDRSRVDGDRAVHGGPRDPRGEPDLSHRARGAARSRPRASRPRAARARPSTAPPTTCSPRSPASPSPGCGWTATWARSSRCASGSNAHRASKTRPRAPRRRRSVWLGF